MVQKQNGLRTATYSAGAAIVLTAAGISFFSFNTLQSRQEISVAPEPIVAPVRTVTALGRVEPAGAVIKLSVANASDSRVDRLLVQEGQLVTAGQVIAVLQGLDKQEAEIIEAEQNLAIQQAELARVLAGESQGNIQAQEAAIARIEAQIATQTQQNEAGIARAQAEFDYAQAEYDRYQQLYQSGAVSASVLDSKQESIEVAQSQLDESRAQLNTTIATLQEQLQQERATLTSLIQISPGDVQVYQAQVDYAMTQLERARAELGDYYVKVPVSGQILEINTQVGEQVDPDEGIVDLGQTDQMYVIAEVYETDITNVKIGQQATITSENGGFDTTLEGTVEFVSLQIKKQDILNTDPAADVDARVVEVKIRLTPEDSAKVATLTNLKVRVNIAVD